MGRRLAIVLLWTLAACAYPLPPDGAGPDLRGWPDAVDWNRAGREASQVLAGYLRQDTRNPPGNETVGASYLADVLRREGIASEIVEYAPGRGSLIARLEGSGKQRPLCLLSHIDVASAESRDWPRGKGPLSGTIDAQNMIWGRGALDMKGMGVLELMTLVWLKRLQVPLQRDVILVAVADEEVDNHGMQFVMQRHFARGAGEPPRSAEWSAPVGARLGCSHMVNEGGLGLKDALFKGQTVFAISVAEKGVLWLRVVAHGASGHGSTPRPGQAPMRLIQALTRIARRVPKPAVHPALEQLFARVGRQHGGVAGFVLRRPALVRGLALDRLMRQPGTRAALIDTVNITVLDTGGNQPNVVPGRATATLDIRLLPGSRPAAVIDELRQLVRDPSIQFEQLSYWPSLQSPQDDPLFRALARQAVAGRDDAVAGPVLSIGFTDSLFARRAGVRAYGLIPFEVTEKEASTMHGVGERVSVTNMRRGLRVLLSAVLEVSADLRARPKKP